MNKLILLLVLLCSCTVPANNDLPADELIDEPEEMTIGESDELAEPVDEFDNVLFTDDFSDVDEWSVTIEPSLVDSSLSSKDVSIYTLESFSGRNGVQFSFDVLPVRDAAIYGGFVVKFVDKSFSSNEAKLEVRADGTVLYWLDGHCVDTPKVETGSVSDGDFHTFSLIAHSDGSAEWLLDGETQMQRSNFDVRGDFTIMISGNSASNPMYLDNINLVSLGEEEFDSDFCTPVVPVVKSNCEPGYCSSNGVCCPRHAQYYCNNVCYASKDEAMSNGQGQCTEWRIIC